MTGIDTIHHYAETIVNVLSILFNTYLLYIIKHYSTFEIKMYKYLLTIDALLDLSLAICILIVQPVVMTAEGFFIMIANGFVAGHSHWLDSVCLTIYHFLLHTNILWIPIQFIYRYIILCKQNWDTRLTNVIIGVVAIGYSITAFMVNAYLSEVVEEFQPEGQNVLYLNEWPKYKDGRYPFVVGSYVTRWRMIASLLLFSTTCNGSIVVVICCEMRIMKHFRRIGDPSVSTNTTQKLHKEFHRALLAMAICPLLTSAVPVLYFVVCIVLKLTPGIIPATVICSLVTSITFFNPLTTILFLRVYRRTTLRFLTCGLRGNAISPVSTSASTRNSFLSFKL